MPKTPKQTLVDTSQDPGLKYLTTQDATTSAGTRRVVSTDSGNVFTQYVPVNQFVYNIVETTNQVSGASGANGDIQFNSGGQISSDNDLRYDPNADALSVKTILVSQHSDLGSVTSIKITGGISGQALTTDGLGNLTWSTIQGGGGGTYDYNQLINKPTLFSGSYLDLTDTPTLFSGSYLDLTDTPSIPSIQGLATETFVTDAIANVNAVGFDGSQQITISNTLTSTSTTTGALKVAGGVGIEGNINAGGAKHTFDGNVHITGVNSKALYVGAYADEAQSFTAPTLIMKNGYQTYVQAGLINSSQYGSSDWVAYADNGSDTDGWADMGMTSHNFSDINYSITGKNDGYFFVKAVQADPSLQLGGNLVLATDSTGTHNDIVFATGGFFTDNVFAKIEHSTNLLHLVRTGSGIKFHDGTIMTTRPLDGLNGAPGRDGTNGINGTNGTNGADGQPGRDGLNGAAGRDGINGTNGIDGAKGDKGDTGAQGISVTLQGTKDTIADLPLPPQNWNDFAGQAWIVTTGDGVTHQNGSLWFWNLTTGEWNDIGPIVGPKGDTGAQGQKGEKGDTGANGLDGRSAYELAVLGGFNGTQADWLTSLIGPRGADGTNGVNGNDGQNGIDGRSAYDLAVDGGFTGTQQEWLASLVGSTGAAGQDGTNGTNGTSFVWQNQWGGGYYVPNDVVSYQGSSYICIAENTDTLPTDTNFWTLMAQKGLDGASGSVFDQNLNTYDTPTFAGIILPAGIKQTTADTVLCNPNMDTVIYTGQNLYAVTFKLLLKLEGVEVNATPWDAQTCEMVIARTGTKVAGSVYGLVYTSNAPLASFTTRINSTSGLVEVLCRPASTSFPVYVRSFATEITTSD